MKLFLHFTATTTVKKRNYRPSIAITIYASVILGNVRSADLRQIFQKFTEKHLQLHE